MPKNPRITLTFEAHKALTIQAALEGEAVGNLASKIILEYAKDAKEALEAIEKKKLELIVAEDIPQTKKKPISRVKQAIIQKKKKELQKKKKLSQDPETLEKIQELWQNGQRSSSQIARKIGYPKTTVRDAIKRMIRRGDIIS
ncbi:MAG: winged helix-turn-helix transcriptional regulator [Methanotrichaceae archaeon]|nr:winged helix-turn-helix transcriptional regulator [Methanotrichaceae archaeon]